MLTLHLRILLEGRRKSPRRPNPEGEIAVFSWRTLTHSDDNDGLETNSSESFEKQRLKCDSHPSTVPGSGQRVLSLAQRRIQQDFPVHRHEFIPRNDATCRRTISSVSWTSGQSVDNSCFSLDVGFLFFYSFTTTVSSHSIFMETLISPDLIRCNISLLSMKSTFPGLT